MANPTGKGGFKKGQSGNPGGKAKEVVEVTRLARQHCEAAIERLVQLMRSSDERVAKSAADSILDRGIGKPVQAIVGDEAAARIFAIGATPEEEEPDAWLARNRPSSGDPNPDPKPH